MPTYALHILTDGITPKALAQAHTPTFDALITQGVAASDAARCFSNHHRTFAYLHADRARELARTDFCIRKCWMRLAIGCWMSTKD